MSDTTNEPLITMTLTADTVVGHRYIEHYSGEDGWSEKVPLTLAGMVVERVMEELRPMVQAELKLAIQKLVSEELKKQAGERALAIIEEALHGDIQQYNSYGEPMRTTTTLKQLIANSAKEWMNGGRNDYGGSPLQKMVAEAVGSAFRNEMRAEADKARAALRKEMSAAGAKLLAEAIEKGFTK